ncbi:conserved hypothetical protein [Neospora caninum Liverpool]|uniref:N-acyl-phosphatidylethanolamine-hydrolyzing phospholipase D n=1 Tax=Neospora caninum (strain Liverpool) TaxID=572307 RepID=F0VI04_NEOCL|nr:conserved hypothetical protein [Neospora caninum Liverpool]CBZ53365.1 conserved hypothetical protein [Neospora caninum Liverpool]CEL67351.1 TPA: N-acyl-phosphatidylethanolamine-hydrolyzing phospholipase D [Neospora caninum Liverpool]|eukprot:XP_003883397.1 conserved hypothetical protein [Neospora caninum Liverpool]
MKRPFCSSLQRLTARLRSSPCSSYSLASPAASHSSLLSSVSSLSSAPLSLSSSPAFSPSVLSPSPSPVSALCVSSRASRRFSTSSFRVLRATLRRFVLHFSPPAASPFPAPSLAERRRFLRYRLLQYQQHAKQQKIPWALFEGDSPQRDRKPRTHRARDQDEAKATGRQHEPDPESGAFTANGASFPSTEETPKSKTNAPPASSGSSFASSLSASFSSSFVNPRWRAPALWPARRLLPPPPPPPEYVFAEDAERHAEEQDGDERGDTADGDREGEEKRAALPLRVQAVGHGTFLLQCGGINVLTDPFFATKAGPFGRLGLPRLSQPGISLDCLPPIDVVLLSSVRFDAYDYASLRFLAKRDGATFFVPSGVLARRYLSPRVFGNVYPMNWGDRVKFDENFLVFFCPAIHAGVGRYGLDWGVPGWGSFVVQWCAKEPLAQTLAPRSKTVYFGGRSAYSRKMLDLIREGARRDRETLSEEMAREAALQREMERERRRRRGEDKVTGDEDVAGAIGEGGGRSEAGTDGFVFDLSILPVGGYEPREYMRRYQMTPEEAVDAHLRLQSKLSLPSHFDVLPVGSEDFREAPSRLIAACGTKGVPIRGFTEHSGFDLASKGHRKTDAGREGGKTAAEKEAGDENPSGEKGGFRILEPGAHLWVL